MANNYYQVRLISHPDENGVVYRIKDSKLEVFAGDFKQRGVKMENGCFTVGTGYIVDEICESLAKKLRADCAFWRAQKAYTSPDINVYGINGRTRIRVFS